MDHELIAALRNHSCGICALEAATEILISQPSRLYSDVVIRYPSNNTEQPAFAEPDWVAISTGIDTGALTCSNGERHMLQIAAAIATGIPIDLREALTGLDDNNIRVIITAIQHATGRRQPSTRSIS
jgi:ABC-type branched-subunit amino acid transport system ATPase component